MNPLSPEMFSSGIKRQDLEYPDTTKIKIVKTCIPKLLLGRIQVVFRDLSRARRRWCEVLYVSMC
jgi:hypothetical protein